MKNLGLFEDQNNGMGALVTPGLTRKLVRPGAKQAGIFDDRGTSSMFFFLFLRVLREVNS